MVCIEVAMMVRWNVSSKKKKPLKFAGIVGWKMGLVIACFFSFPPLLPPAIFHIKDRRDPYFLKWYVTLFLQPFIALLPFLVGALTAVKKILGITSGLGSP